MQKKKESKKRKGEREKEKDRHILKSMKRQAAD